MTQMLRRGVELGTRVALGRALVVPGARALPLRVGEGVSGSSARAEYSSSAEESSGSNGELSIKDGGLGQLREWGCATIEKRKYVAGLADQISGLTIQEADALIATMLRRLNKPPEMRGRIGMTIESTKINLTMFSERWKQSLEEKGGEAGAAAAPSSDGSA